MTSAQDPHNIPLDMHNIYPTYTTSPGGDLRRQGVVDVVHVVPKKNLRGTYLLSVIARRLFSLPSASALASPTYPRTYLGHNMHNISKTWAALSRCVQIALGRLTETGHATHLDHDTQHPPITTWQEVADWVDEPTWQRILDDLAPTTRAECEQIRPPARQAEARNRLTRAHQRSPR